MPDAEIEAILRDLDDANDTVETLLLMPEKDLWNFICTGGFEEKSVNELSFISTSLILRLRAAKGIKEDVEFDKVEIANGCGMSKETIEFIRAMLTERAL